MGINSTIFPFDFKCTDNEIDVVKKNLIFNKSVFNLLLSIALFLYDYQKL